MFLRPSSSNLRLALAVLIWLVLVLPARAQSPITVGQPQIVNDFPQRLVVHFPIHSSAGDIIDVRGRVRFGAQPTYHRIPLDFAPGKDVVATWEWDTSRSTVPPYVPLDIQLEIKDARGNRLKTPLFSLIYEDNRFAWRERRSEHLIVRWYEGSDKFGEEIFRLAQDALERQIRALSIVPERPLVLVIYATEEDFFAWHSYRTEWIGGQAFPDYGVAAQIIPPDSKPDWIYDVIPHEINHLLVAPYMATPLGTTPTWIEEGLAQYFEQSSTFTEHYRLKQAAKQGRVLPLGVMRNPPGQDKEEALLWYAQALGMVEYLIDHYGEERLQSYMRLLHQGRPATRAFTEAFGESEEAFYARWRASLGLPGPTATPTSTATFTPLPSPTPTRARTSTPSPTPTWTRKHLPTPNAGPTPTPTPAPSPNSIWLLLLGTISLASGLGLLVAILVLILRRHWGNSR